MYLNILKCYLSLTFKNIAYPTIIGTTTNTINESSLIAIHCPKLPMYANLFCLIKLRNILL